MSGGDSTFKKDVIEFVELMAAYHQLTPIEVTRQLTEIGCLHIDGIEYHIEWLGKRIYDLEKERAEQYDGRSDRG